MLKRSPQSSTSGEEVALWLKASGMSFNPFEIVESSQDSNLSRYLVEHNELINMWGNWPNLVFAPAGGGKTAMRIRLTQACLTGGELNRPFPINYSIPFLKWDGKPATYDAHLDQILITAGLYLLVYLACRPRRFFKLDRREQEHISQVLNWVLPGPILTFMEPCIQAGNLKYLIDKFPHSLIPPQQDLQLSLDFIKYLKELSVFQTNSSLFEKWETFINMVIHLLKFPSIYLLVDGIDAAPTTSNNPKLSSEYILPLLKKTKIWSANSIFIKSFLPSEIHSYLDNNLPDLVDEIHTINIQWTYSSLADVIRKRVYVASEGVFGSLQPLCSPAISEVEMQIARSVALLPREIIVFTKQLLINHVSANKVDNQIQPDAFNQTVHWYKNNRAFSQQ